MRPVGVTRRRFGKLIFGIFLTVFVGWSLYHFTNWIFTIRSIEVVGEHTLVSIDQNRISKNLLFFPSESLRSQILANNPWLADVRFEKKFPGTLRIVPVKRRPVAILHSADRTVLVSDNGVVLSDGDNGNILPRLFIPTPAFRIGQKIEDERVRQSLALITGLIHEFVFTKITYEEGKYLRAKTDTSDIIFVQDKPIGDVIATLQTLLSGFRIKGTLPKVVDLRFDKPIVTF